MRKIYIGYDERQPVSFTVLAQSIISQASEPVAIIPLKLNQLPIKRCGLTPFTYSRFLVPYLEKSGLALFLDIDTVLNGDVCELFKYVEAEQKRLDTEREPPKAIWVSKNNHKFEWASVMMFECNHPAHKVLTPEGVETHSDMHRIGWLDAELVGDLPREWNQLIGYDAPNKAAKLVHYTQGVPAYPETVECEHSELWHKWHQYSNYTQPWESLMGQSIHAVQVNEKKLPKFLFDLEKQEPKPEHAEHVRKIMSAA